MSSPALTAIVGKGCKDSFQCELQVDRILKQAQFHGQPQKRQSMFHMKVVYTNPDAICQVWCAEDTWEKVARLQRI